MESIPEAPIILGQPPLSFDPCIKSAEVFCPITYTDVENDYKLEGEIEEGGFSRVYKARSRIVRGPSVAIKVFDKNGPKFKAQNVRAELAVHSSLNSPRVVVLHEIFETETTIAMVMEKADCDLFHVVASRNYLPSEEFARRAMKQVLECLQEMEEESILHCDIKPESFLVFGDGQGRDTTRGVGRDFRLKLCDFGLCAAPVPSNDLLFFKGNARGTLDYMSPESATLNRNSAEDEMWSAGVILFILLTGDFPFGVCDGFKSPQWGAYVARLVACDYEKSYLDRNNVSEKARDLLSKLLCPGRKRLSPEQALQHTWFTAGSN